MGFVAVLVVLAFELASGLGWLLRMWFGLLVIVLASALRCLLFTRCPCAGRHLLFFAAAKKSR
ncbi:hypothetical protein BZM27_33285, partial [Paraburkholderia steynii]